MEQILKDFQKVTPWQWLKTIEEKGLKLKTRSGNHWVNLSIWKGNFEGYANPILLYKKENGQMVPYAVAITKTLN